MPRDFDFTEPTELEKPRRKRRDDDYEPRKQIDHIELAMLILAISAAFLGGVILMNSKTIMHEILASQCFVVASIFFVGGMIYGKLAKRRERD